jgi:hypothetical protein
MISDNHWTKEKECAYKKCNKIFKPITANQKFCNQKCLIDHYGGRKKKITKVLTCKWCNEKFEKTGYGGNLKQVKYCSQKCSLKAQSARKKTGATNHSSKITLKRRGKSSANESCKVKLGLPDYIFGNATFCTYCGESMINSPTSIDHCIPRSFFLDVGVKGSNARGLTTYSCFKCNSILSDKIFDTFRLRRECITNHYQSITDRFFNEENTWTEEELDEHEVDYSLRKYIEQKIWNRYVLIDKINWPFSIEYKEILDSVKFDILYTDILNDSQIPFMKKFFEIK